MTPAKSEAPTRTQPLVVVAGRPNVGKSTLVNRIVGRRAAVVEERPGVTRDRKELDAEWCGHHFTIVDTGGWLSSDDPLDAQVSAQSERAIGEADVILFVVDVTVGLTDEEIATLSPLRLPVVRKPMAIAYGTSELPALLTEEKDDQADERLALLGELDAALQVAFAHFLEGHVDRRAGAVDQQKARLVGAYITTID